MTTNTRRAESASVDLYWLPLGAGDASQCVRWNGRVFEALAAGYEHRERCDLYHSALEVHLDGDRFVIEMAPVWGNKEADRHHVPDTLAHADERSAGPLALGVARQRWKAGTTKSGRWPSCRESVGLPLAVTARRIHLTPATEQAVRTTNSIAPARLPSGSAASRCDRSRPAAGW